MPARRDKRGKWFYRKVVRLPNGEKVRISGWPSRNTKQSAEQAERARLDDLLRSQSTPPEKEVPTFGEWFTGRFWREWVVGRRNKPGEAEEKMRVYHRCIAKVFGDMRLDAISVSEINS